MKVIEITRPGGPEVLAFGERPRPELGPNDVLIRVRAAGVNRPDIQQRRGLYPPPPGATDLPGLDVSGVVEAVSEGVTKFTDIAIVGARRGEVNKQITSPCGVCRQALFEFGGPELNVIMAKTPDDFIERSMDELLPFGFGPSNVAGNKAVEE